MIDDERHPPFDDEEHTVQMRVHFDRKGQPVSCPPGAAIVWRVSTYACIRQSNKVLMIIPPWSTVYELPGGTIDVSNSVEYSLKESVKRETGMRVTAGSARPMYVGEANFFDDETEQYCHNVYFVFDCLDAVPAGKPLPFLSYEEDERRKNTRIEWVEISDLNKENLHPMHHQLLEYFGVDH